MRMPVNPTGFACLLLLLLGRSVLAFDFKPIEDSVIGPATVRSRFPSNFRVTAIGASNLVDTYKLVAPEATPLRVLARTYTWGMGSNRLSCVDLRTSSIAWEWNLDGPVIQVLQTNEGAFALTFRSLYALDLTTGVPRWQIDVQTGQFKTAITMASAEQAVKVSNDEEAGYLRRMGISTLSFIAYNAAEDQLVLSLQDNGLIAVRSNGTISARQKPFSEADRADTINAINCLYSMDDAIYVFYADRLLRRLGKDLTVTNQIYFPENSLKGIAEFSNRTLLVGGSKDMVYSWERKTDRIRAATSKLSAVSAAMKTRDGDLLVSTMKGLVKIDPESLETTWTFRGDRMTAWFAVVPITFREHSWQVWSFTENGHRRKILASGSNLFVVDSRSGKELSKTTLPVSLCDSRVIRFMWFMLGAFTVPPYVDLAERRMYLPMSEVGGEVTQSLDTLSVKDHIVEISW